MGSSRLKDITPGMDREKAIAVMGTGPLTAVRSDTSRLDHGFRRMQFFANGKNFEVIYYRELPGAVTEPVVQSVETPVVLLENKVLGTGWRFYVDAMKQYGLPTPLIEKDTTRKQMSDSTSAAAAAKAKNDSMMTKAPVTKTPPTADSLRKKM